jgi:nitroreductase
MNTHFETHLQEHLEALGWRYATKKFDPARTLSENELATLLEAVRLSPSSYGLQPYKILVISDPGLRERLKPACWNQAQITEASHLLVFAHRTDFGPELIDSYLEEVADTRGASPEALKGYGNFMKSKLLGLLAAEKAAWTARQAYIALGTLLSAAAEARIDTCAIEGFEPFRVNEILGLDSQQLSAGVMAAVGYRSEGDATQHNKKVRRSHDALFAYL